MNVAAAAAETDPTALTTTESHLWEILLTVCTGILVVVTVVLIWATLLDAKATARAAAVEMRKVAREAIRDMRDVSLAEIDNKADNAAARKA